MRKKTEFQWKIKEKQQQLDIAVRRNKKKRDKKAANGIKFCE